MGKDEKGFCFLYYVIGIERNMFLERCARNVRKLGSRSRPRNILNDTGISFSPHRIASFISLERLKEEKKLAAIY